jgi:hypothetical protein
MNDIPRERPQKDDARLNGLIRAARDGDSKFVRPDGDAITAYLMGTASEDQRKSMQEALVQSASFRREILCMAEDMAALEGLSHGDRMMEAPQAQVPSLDEFLKRHERDRRAEMPLRESLEFRARLRWLFEPRILVRAAAISLVVAIFFVAMVGARSLWLPSRKCRL